MQLKPLALLLPLAAATPLSDNIFARQGTCGTCVPFPEQNICDQTTSCVYTTPHEGPDGPHYCACRGGYRATTSASPGDTSVQWRFTQWPGQEGRVFVAPGATCDTLCNDNTCSEVGVRDDCI